MQRDSLTAVATPGSISGAKPGAPGPVFLICLAGLAALSAAVVLFATARYPLGVNADSVIYLDAARRLGRDLSYSAFQYGVVKPLTHFPPLLSLLLAPFESIGSSPLFGARWVNAALLGITTASAGWIVFRLTSNRAVALLCGLTLLASSDVFQMYATVRSEVVFLPLVLWGVYLLGDHLATGKKQLLVLAGVCAALASLARYPGIVLSGAGGLVILLSGTSALRDRLKRSLLFGLISAGPLAAWLVSNKLRAGTATNREMALHPGDSELFYELNQTISAWVFPMDGEFTAARFVLSGVVLTVLFLAARFLLKRSGAQRSFTLVALSFSGLYMVLLLLSIALADAQTPLNGRHLLPVFLMFVPIAGMAIAGMRSSGGLKWLLAVAGTVAAIGIPALMTKKLMNRYHSVGYGYSGARWQRANLRGLVALAPRHLPIYSNAPEVVYFLTGRDAQEIPAPRNRWTRRVEPRFSARMQTMADHVSSGGMVIYLDGIPRRFVPEIPEIAAYVGRDPEAWLPYVAVFGSSLTGIARPERL